MRTSIRIEVETDEIYGAVFKKGVKETYNGYIHVDGDFETIVEVVQHFLKTLDGGKFDVPEIRGKRKELSGEDNLV